MTDSNREVIYNAVKDRYEFEIERINLLDDKANNLVSIASILAALTSGFAVLSVKLSNPTVTEAAAFLFFLVCLVLLVATLCFSIGAYQIRSYIVVPEPPNLIVWGEKMEADKILESLYINYALATNENEKKNKDKISYIKIASWLLLSGILVFAIFVFLSIASR